MSEKDLISVIIPCYNSEEYLGRCLNSVIKQSYSNLQIILIDDGSTDSTPVQCDEWADKDNRICVFHIENKGVANARNVGLKNVRGEYIAFVDSDDYMLENMFSDLINISKQYNADIVKCGYFYETPNDTDTIIKDVSTDTALKKILVAEYDYGFIWNKLYRKNIVQNVLFPDFVCCEDLVFNYSVFKKAKSIVEVDTQYYCYFQNPGSTVHGKFTQGAFDAVKSKELILKDVLGSEYEKYAIKGLITSAYVVLSGCIQNGVFYDKQKELRKEILKYKKEIVFNKNYSLNHRLRTILLWLAPHIYNFLVKMKG